MNISSSEKNIVLKNYREITIKYAFLDTRNRAVTFAKIFIKKCRFLVKNLQIAIDFFKTVC